MRTIDRHYVDADFVEERVTLLVEQLPNFVGLAKRKPTALQSVMKLSLDVLGYHCVTDPEAAWIDTWDSFVSATQAGSAIFVVASQDDGEVEFRLGDEVVQVAAPGPSMQNDALTWLNALYLAMVLRDQERINFLARVPVEVLRAAGLDYDDYVYSMVRMWQAYWRGEDDLVERVLDAMRAADPDSVEHTTPRVVLQVHFPVIEAFYQFILRDEAKFNDALANALELHKEFWTKDEESEVDPRGFVALGLLALACHAKDMGLSIEVESEYMPEVLLKGSRIGEGIS